MRRAPPDNGTQQTRTGACLSSSKVVRAADAGREAASLSAAPDVLQFEGYCYDQH